MPLNRLSINGKPYQIADESQIKSGRRSYIETPVPSQPFEVTPIVVSWALWGPIGDSRARYGGSFSTDYADNLNHRFDWLLTSTPKRNALALTSLTASAYGVPTSDVTKTNWSQGAGDGDGSAFDELDEGIESGTPDDATTYWTTTSSGVANRLECNITSLTDPGFDDGEVVMRFRVNTTAGDSINLKLSQGTSSIYQVIVGAATSTWETLAVTIPEAAVANISDWTDLELALWRNSGSNELACSAMELEVPNAKFGPVISIDEQSGYLFAHRGSYATQIESGVMTERFNVDRTTKITSTTAEWQGEAYLAHGSAAVVDKRTGVSAGGATYASISSVDATHLAIGGSKLWILDAGVTTSADKGKAKYTLDSAALTSAGLSNGFFIADPSATYTGLYASGPYMLAGHSRGVSSFTDSGKEVPLLTAVKDFPSVLNAAAGDDGFEGWVYIATKLGLYAINVEGGVVNPVGPGEGLAGQGFEGPIDGYPTAVRYFKDSLWVAYLNPDGTTYLFRGQFGPQTGATGRPDWFSFRKMSGVECHALGVTTGRTTGATLVVGEDEDIAYYDLSLRGREIADANYAFDTGGGTWYGTTLMLPSGMQGYLRWGKFLTENCRANNTTQFAVDVDDAGSPINIGAAVTADGLQTVRPVSGGSPLSTVGFTSIKPQLTQAADSETSPPQIRGELALGIDARPDMVTEIEVLLELKTDGEYATLKALVGDDQIIPVPMRLPSATPVNTDQYGHVLSVDWRDRSNPDDNVALVRLREWELS